MSWSPTVGERVRYIGTSDCPCGRSNCPTCTHGVTGIVTSLHDDMESWCGIPERPIAVRLFNGWPAAFAANELEPMS